MSAGTQAGRPGERIAWFRSQQRHLDTVVFVHGILGHHAKTWGEFPRLLAEDEDLPELDILLWGYRTGWFTRHQDLKTEGACLASGLEILIRNTNDIVLVGHSMGGLVILKALIDRMDIGHAQQWPCRGVAWVSLFAAPLDGVWVAGMLRSLFLLPLWITRALHTHLRDLSVGTFVEDLMTAVRRCIYQPHSEGAHARKIPIRIIAGSQDEAVARCNRLAALAPYQDPAALQLDADHRTIKLPVNRFDRRYRALADDLHRALSRSFRRLCATVASPGSSELQRGVAVDDMLHRYGRMVHRHLQRWRIPEALAPAAEDAFLLLLAKAGAGSEAPPHEVVRAVAVALRRRRLERL